MGTAKRIVDTAKTAWRGLGERHVPYWSWDRLRRLQNERLHAILGHAYNTVPFYRKAMDERGLRPRDIRTAEDLTRLPLIDGRMLQRSPGLFASSAYGEGSAQPLLSTGTAGTGRRRILWSNEALLAELAAGERDRAVLYGILGKRWGLRRLSLHPEASTTRATLRYQWGRVHVPRFVAETRYVPPDSSYEVVVEEIERFRPDVVYSYGSILEYFCRFVVDRGIEFHAPRAWVYGADGLSDEGRALVRERFGCAVLSTYQSVECGRIGFQCEEEKGFHLNVDRCVVRIVDAEGRDVAPGESGEVVVSNLVNHATVLVNYRQSDRAAFAPGRCACGRTLPLLERLEGRMSDVLHLADGREVLDHVLIHACKKVLANTLQFQIVEEQPGTFRWRVVPASGTDGESLVAALHAHAAAVLSSGDVLTIELTERIEIPKDGKLSRVVRPAAATSLDP
ncbi:MAG: hypothetical protein PHW86_08700 [Candidatus Bipolaricaulis sp.]|nr:hypothetical protein [Candidatus Bipolaricaulis sp.]